MAHGNFVPILCRSHSWLCGLSCRNAQLIGLNFGCIVLLSKLDLTLKVLVMTIDALGHFETG